MPLFASSHFGIGAIVAGSAAIGSGLLAWARWWGERLKPKAETDAVIVGVYGTIIDDLKEEMVRLRELVRECEQHRAETDLALESERTHRKASDRLLTEARADIARLIEERPPPTAAPPLE